MTFLVDFSNSTNEPKCHAAAMTIHDIIGCSLSGGSHYCPLFSLVSVAVAA
jgi:hypothetical protein